MSQNSPEDISGQNLEQTNTQTEQQDPPVLDFEELNLGDQILLYFDSGAYQLVIDGRDDTGQLYAQLKVGRAPQLSHDIKEWIDNPNHMLVNGSCEGLKVEQGAVMVVAPKLGCFIVGKNAWLSFVTEAGDKAVVSNKITSIERKLSEGDTDEL